MAQVRRYPFRHGLFCDGHVRILYFLVPSTCLNFFRLEPECSSLSYISPKRHPVPDVIVDACPEPRGRDEVQFLTREAAMRRQHPVDFIACSDRDFI